MTALSDKYLTLDDIRALKEDNELECKKASGRDGAGSLPNDFWPTYSAFANTDGGEVFLGLEEKPDKSFDLVGIATPEKVKQDLLNLLNNREKISANILFNDDVIIHTIEGKSIIQVSIPRASRRQKPVYVGKNPLGGTYVRRGDGDFVLDEASVKKLLAEQGDGSCDERILKGYTIEDDLDADSIKAYRNTFASLKPDHPFIQQDLQEFLRSIGAWRKDRETSQQGLTLAGLLMFGKLRPILDELPHYILDYQERPLTKGERWIDRLTTDGSWSGNLYDFYIRVYSKLVADLKVPFKLIGATRQDQTPVHEALREALVNTLIHADYSGRVSIAVIKRSDVFAFRNPGLMRVPTDQALRGGDSDCRNRNLQKMFQMIGAAEQAGSGIPKIYQSWQQQHWRKPRVLEKPDPEQTIFELHRASLLPPETMQTLDNRFGEKFRSLEDLERTILVAAATEDFIEHKRAREISGAHPADVSKALSILVRDGFLHSYGSGRGTSYYIVGGEVDDLIGSPALPFMNSSGLEVSSVGLAQSSLGLEGDSIGIVEHKKQVEEKESEISMPSRQNKKLNKNSMETIVLSLCALRPQPIEKIAKLLDRNADFLRNSYINPLIKNGKLELLYPEVKNHPNQAYKAVMPSININNSDEGKFGGGEGT